MALPPNLLKNRRNEMFPEYAGLAAHIKLSTLLAYVIWTGILNDTDLRNTHLRKRKQGEHTRRLFPVDTHHDHRFCQVINLKLTSALYLI